MELLWDGKNVKTTDAQSITALVKGCYGENKKGSKKVRTTPEGKEEKCETSKGSSKGKAVC